VRVGAIAFSDNIVGKFFMSTNIGFNSKQRVYNSFDFYQAFGTTNTPSALESARSEQFTSLNGDRPNVQNYVICITDGNSNVNAQNTIPDAQALKGDGVIIYTIAVGDSPQMSEILGIASSPASQYVIRLPTLGDIETAAKSLLDNICQ